MEFVTTVSSHPTWERPAILGATARDGMTIVRHYVTVYPSSAASCVSLKYY